MRPNCLSICWIGLFFVFIPEMALAQTEGLPAIAREVFRQRTEVPPSPVPRIVTERTVPEPPVTPPTVVVERPATVERLVPDQVVTTATSVVAWPAVFARYRYGFFDDGNVDDNWYYDYYEIPTPPAAVATTVVKPVTETAPGYRTGWKYDALAERGLFSW